MKVYVTYSHLRGTNKVGVRATLTLREEDKGELASYNIFACYDDDYYREPRHLVDLLSRNDCPHSNSVFNDFYNSDQAELFVREIILVIRREYSIFLERKYQEIPEGTIIEISDAI